MAQVDFGVFDWIDRGRAPLHQLYEERLQLLDWTSRGVRPNQILKGLV